jgi:hypothetical protein
MTFLAWARGARLDAAVRTAYGMPNDADPLAFLLALEEKVRSYLSENTTRGGAQADIEIERAIERAPDWIKLGRANSHSKWPKVNLAKRQEAISNGIGIEELRGISPRKQMSAHQVLPILFPGNPLIWAARSVRPEQGDTLPLRQWLPVAGLQQFIVPNPMISRDIPYNGKSKRCLTNTGPRVYLVVESDSGTADEQAAILWHLANFARLVMAIHSASKSVHGWFYVAERSEEENREFMEYAVSLGADPATWVKCQAVRMPGGHRLGKGKQEILFFNPAAIGGAK